MRYSGIVWFALVGALGLVAAIWVWQEWGYYVKLGLVGLVVLLGLGIIAVLVFYVIQFMNRPKLQ